jgi:GT2 family glycosyltransferase
MGFSAELQETPATRRGAVPIGSAAGIQRVFEGYVDFYGYHEAAGGWFFAGWMTNALGATILPCEAIARFKGIEMSDQSELIYYRRPDVAERGSGFVFFMRAPARTENAFVNLTIELGGILRNVVPAHGASNMPRQELEAHLLSLLSEDMGETQRQKLKQLMQFYPEAAPVSGCIECYGHHASAGGWLVAGWIVEPWAADAGPSSILLSFEDGDLEEPVLAKLYARPDLKGVAQGVIFFVPNRLQPMGALCAVAIQAGGVRHWLSPLREVQHMREAELSQKLSAALRDAVPEGRRDRLTNILLRRPYAGEDTSVALRPAIFFCVDEAILCGGDGLVLIGWMLAQPKDLVSVKLHCGGNVVALERRDFVRIARPDVLAAVVEHEPDDDRCGFATYLPHAAKRNEPCYIEVEAADGQAGYALVPRPRLQGIAAIKRLLEVVDVRFLDMQLAFDTVLGPAVAAINGERLGKHVGETVFQYGVMPEAPKYSVIVPLHGRMDFLEYQQALFSARHVPGEVEFIYVIDDPRKRRDAAYLCVSVHERFQMPFKVVLLEQNVGYAPANNIGLRHARGEFVAFLNSDVFPGTPDWLERLTDRLAADKALGVVGPLLLYEDGSVQHQGMYFKALPEFGNWYFGHHQDKGKRYARGEGLQPAVAITGACMVMRRELAVSLGGFDETYVIGDFEDSDLCMRIQARGLSCAVDPQVRLYHLERQSQSRSGTGWRMNLTAYNAWQHHRRWAKTIEKKFLA